MGINLLGLDGNGLKNLVVQWGWKCFRAIQLQRWIHQDSVDSFDKMTNLTNTFRNQLNERAFVQAPSVVRYQNSLDETIKWIFDVGQNNEIEAVFIPENNRGTLCISSQAGCAVGCSFCSTGYQGFNRNLQTSEIIGQLWWANRFFKIQENKIYLNQKKYPLKNGRPISNVVMMGMGEPLLNYRNLLPALRLMLDKDAYGLSRRRVTVSTSGVIPMMDRLSQDCPVSLAVSLHATNDILRNKLVPLNKKYPLNELFSACQRYIDRAPRNSITFEYCMLDAINDSDQHARELVKLSRRLRCKINLIPFNSFPQSKFRCSSSLRINRFSQHLADAGIIVTIRKTRGDDVNAACGQLIGKIDDKTGIMIRKEELMKKFFINS